ncbi:type I glyceraldehyde-3-phosphate dehydrogenase [Phytohalomonas tamaricis]|uniref:type I glyceraldehyde-3-phosphate dehydrogenase n=1 Tax=Phytohalomonas tamaricis TaxID=2081032 RepID=UPI000D0BD21C|nr:glyceraldehyde 3-phosphate dehydrogenase NAD-binding domain-containing protein [Phytohalomonas tamaricis]
MPYRVAINGYGRIGRCVLRAFFERHDLPFEIVAINDLADPNTLAYLTRFDTTHGRFPGQVELNDTRLTINGHTIELLREPHPELLPWRELGIDLLLECSGSFTSREMAERHLAAGAGRLLFSQPAKDDVDSTIVCGVNDASLKPEHRIVSAASCTTNALIPLLDVLDRTFGIACGVTTTLHSAMNDQPVIDAAHPSDLRLTRSAIASIIPVGTGLGLGITRLMPHLEGRFECLHVRVPTLNVSAMDMAITVERDTSADEINALMRQVASGPLAGLVGYTEEPMASIDFNHDPRSSIVDGTQTRVAGRRLIKLFCWFDNEWGYTNRMLDVARHWMTMQPMLAPRA